MKVLSNTKRILISKIIPSFFTIKEGFFESLRLPLAKGSSTFLTKPLFNSLYAPFGSPSSGGQKPSGTRGCNRPTVLNFLPLRLSCKESSTFSPSPSQWSLHPLRFPRSRGTETSGSGDVTALRCSEPLRSKVGGPKRSSPYFAGWDRRGWEVYNLQFIINSLLFRVNSL